MDRNLILALVLTGIILLGWEALVIGPQREAAEAALREAGIEAAEQAGVPVGLDVPTVDATLDRMEALAQAPGRVAIDTESLTGSINLRGAAIDDVSLKRYRIEPDDDAPLVTRLSPRAAPKAQFVIPGVVIGAEAGDSDVWRVVDGETLTDEAPVTLERRTGEVVHRLTFRVADDYLIETRHKVYNRGGEAVTIRPYTSAFQRGLPDDLFKGLAFEGPIAVAGGTLEEVKYTTLAKKPQKAFDLGGTGGWSGLASKYWLTAAIPPQNVGFEASVSRVETGGAPRFRSSYMLDPITLRPGTNVDVGGYVFVGPKRVDLLSDYEDAYGVDRFDDAIDWGILFFLTRPIFAGLSFFAGLFSSMGLAWAWGLAILALTLVIKAILFPLANASYRSLAAMRKLSPEIQALRERNEGDQVKTQQEMMALYKKHKVNPAAGCLPILAQMPIFFALYKVLFTTIELRHQPFAYIDDLSEQDPTTVFNLFGLLPFDPTVAPVIGAFLGIGVLPLLMGVAMWVQTKLNPPPPDPIQAKIFGFMPLIFIFIFAPFAAGLVLYWFWNTLLGVIQQYVIMRRAGAEVDLLGNLRSSFRRKPASEAPAE